MKKLMRIAKKHWREDSMGQFACRVLRAVIAECARIQGACRHKTLKWWIKDNYVTKDILGSKMHLSMRDKGISSDLIVFGVKEPLATRVVLDTVRSEDIVVDIGANIGYYALLESRLVGPNGRIFAIEPVENNLRLLRLNIELNRYSNIDTFHLAIGNKNTRGKIYLSDKSNCASMIYREGVSVVSGSTKTASVDVMTLDTFLDGKPLPDMIRMDVEGYEHEIVQGMKGLLEKEIPLKIFMEIHPAYLGQERLAVMLDTLASYGFRCTVATGRPLYSRSHLLQKLFYSLSYIIDRESQDGYLYRNSDLGSLKAFTSQEVFPKVLFERT